MTATISVRDDEKVLSSDGVLHCPFCGEKPVRIAHMVHPVGASERYGTPRQESRAVMCKGMYRTCSGQGKIADSREGAVALWNRRRPPHGEQR